MFQTVRYSGADGDQCTNNGCYPYDPWCMCQTCPVCMHKRVPLCILMCKSQYTKHGKWVGPHCIQCDMNLYFGRQLGGVEDQMCNE